MELSANDLIEQTRALVVSLKRNYLAIGANLYRIHEGWTGTADEWVSFYQDDLELGKSQVSKLLKVGSFVLAHGFQNETVSYDKLYLSINAHKDEDPKYILSEAKTWSSDDYKTDAKENCGEHDYQLFCSKCWKKHP